MTIDKETLRLLSRAERMRSAILESGVSRQWCRSDLEHMAEAANMLWSQAQTMAARAPDSAPLLAEAIARIFEPLLVWEGQFKLAARLAHSRRGPKAFAAPKLDAEACLFEWLALSGKFEDAYPWQRLESFEKAQQLHAVLAPAWHELTPRNLARVAHGWHLMDRPRLAEAALNACARPTEAAAFYLESDAPKFWREANLDARWLKILRHHGQPGLLN
jgi:hypothetical protein